MSANEEFNMELPEGKTCGDCIHIGTCKAIYDHVESDRSCDWYPVIFREKGKA